MPVSFVLAVDELSRHYLMGVSVIAKFVEIAYGIKKLQISCVVEDDKVSVDLLEEKITDFDELVQSVDIASFNKI